ncbi:hypothetical protein [Bradyrhizobium icense]|uniref:hypothetical protein n=1 Tax=Bradyrhizobium icense TaxID=1274631 RepID=UPI0012E9DC59|nr:hypothetical protein [Bradyrhizobium icense]
MLARIRRSRYYLCRGLQLSDRWAGHIGGHGWPQYLSGRPGSIGPFLSIGPLVAGDLRHGADIVVQAGVGAIGPNYAAFAARYLDPANLAQPGIPLADQAGKVAKAYDEELFAWLQNRFGPGQRPFVHNGRTFVFSGGKGDALAFFLTLPTGQQGVFLRDVYYEELRLSGREYNDSASTRFGSYLRGREAIEALFRETDANGAPIQRKGDITIFGGAHIRTDFGGNIQMLAPNGQIIVGVEGEVPPSTAGIVTLQCGCGTTLRLTKSRNERADQSF